MVKIKYYPATVWEVFQKRPADKLTFVSKATQFNNYELRMMTLKGATFAVFKIQR